MLRQESAQEADRLIAHGRRLILASIEVQVLPIAIGQRVHPLRQLQRPLWLTGQQRSAGRLDRLGPTGVERRARFPDTAG